MVERCVGGKGRTVAGGRSWGSCRISSRIVRTRRPWRLGCSGRWTGSGSTPSAGFVASIELITFGESLAADHRANPRDSLSMDMLNAERRGRRLSDREFGRLFQNLIVGGIETTRNTLGWLVINGSDAKCIIPISKC